MKHISAITAAFASAAIAATSLFAAPAQAQLSSNQPAWPPAYNPRLVEWPAEYGKLPAQAPTATFSNNAGTARCGVYNVDGQSFVHCISTVDTMPGHQCYRRGQSNAMILGTGDSWNCADTNAYAGAPAIGPLQFRRFGDVVVFSDSRNNFIIGYSNLSRAIRVGEINDNYIEYGKVTAFNAKLRGSSIPTGSSI